MKNLVLLMIMAAFIGFADINAQVETHTSWVTSVTKLNDTEVMLNFTCTINDGWHLYSPYNTAQFGLPLELYFEDDSKIRLEGGIVELDKPIEYYDDIFEETELYFEGQARFQQKIKVLSESDFILKGSFEGQICTEAGRCIPVTDDFTFKIPGAKTTSQQEIEETKIDEMTEIDSIPADDSLADVIDIDTTSEAINLARSQTTPIIVSSNPYSDSENQDKSSLFWFFIISFLFGLAALITPCVFPMIPMTVSFFMHSEKSKAKSRIKALVYGISIVVIYTVPVAVLVVIANLFGNDSVSADFANFLSTHWLPNIFFFLIFIVFAASFLGMFEIILPSWLVNKSDQQASKGGMLGTFFMAFTLVLVSFSCTGPIVGGILVESTQGGAVIKPLLGMLGFSIGVAIPFTLFAFFPAWLQNLPKSGGWLNSVKVILGFIELALGLKFLSIADQTYHWGILDREIYIALWIVIFTLMGLYLIGKIKFAHDSDLKYIKVPRLALAIISFSFVLYLIPGLLGAPLKALSGYLPPKSTLDFDLAQLIKGEQESTICEEPMYAEDLHLPHGLQGYFDIYQALECSKENNKPIFIDFTGHGCVNCREMEANVWSDDRVLEMLKQDFIICALYVDDKKIEIPKSNWFTSVYDNKVKKTLGKQNADIQIVNFNKNSQPYYVLLDFEGNVLAEPRAYDLNVDEFVKFLEAGKAEFTRKHPF